MYSKIKKCKFSVISAKPIDIRDIERFEKDLDFTFGNEYRKFLEQFGCLSIDYLEFYGICGNNESVPSAVYMTKRMREDLDFFPENLVVIHEVMELFIVLIMQTVFILALTMAALKQMKPLRNLFFLKLENYHNP